MCANQLFPVFSVGSYISYVSVFAWRVIYTLIWTWTLLFITIYLLFIYYILFTFYLSFIIYSLIFYRLVNIIRAYIYRYWLRNGLCTYTSEGHLQGQENIIYTTTSVILSKIKDRALSQQKPCHSVICHVKP